jgi:hypothetical protein
MIKAEIHYIGRKPSTLEFNDKEELWAYIREQRESIFWYRIMDEA